MSFKLEVQRLLPLFAEAERDHEVYTSAWASGHLCDSERDRLLTRHRASTEIVENEAAAICDGLVAGRPEAVNSALAFLSIRHKPFRSGYACARIARRLKRAALDESQRGIFREIILDRLSWPWGHTPDLWRCYPALRTAASDSLLRQLAESPTPFIARRAMGLLARLGP